MTTDSLYTTSLAHRSIARAALHLGIEGMETKALEALGGAFIDYLERIGSTISHNVELSGRSSAHINVYDVLAAIEECTCPAADQLAAASASAPATTNGHANGEISQSKSGGWEALASFLFGPNWHLFPLEGENANDTPSLGGNINTPKLNAASPKPTGGKSMSALISSANASGAVSSGKQLSRLAASTAHANNNEKNVSFTFDRQGSIGPDSDAVHKSNAPFGSGRWNAPYPYTVAPFPLTASSRADTSKLFHDLATEMEACRDKPLLKRKSSDGTVESSSNKKPSDVTCIAQAAEEMAIMETALIDDAIYKRKFTLNWGCIEEGKDVQMKDSTGDKKPTPAGDEKTTIDKIAAASIKAKYDAAAMSKPFTKQASQKKAPPVSSNAPNRKPPYVPKFMPPFPPTQEDMEHDRQLSVSASKVMGSVLSGVLGSRDKKKPKSKEEPGKMVNADEVRQSVIELGKSTTYWGSGWQERASKKDESKYSVRVLSGEVSASNDAVMKESTGLATKKPNADMQVVPLGRASGSRVSKMLEGSMN